MQRKLMFTLIGLTVLAAAGRLIVGGGAGSAAAASAAADPIVLEVGDQVQVRGVPIGCLVRRLKGETIIDCRRAGPQTGTYGTLISPTKVHVVRFQSAGVGKVVLTAKHEQKRVATCR